MTRIHRAAVPAALMALAATASAETYYVSPAGRDDNDGLSPAKAWKTAAKVNAAALKSGDQVLFARGGEWRESLHAPADGAAGKPIVFAAYGNGAKPTFHGSDVLRNAEFRPADGLFLHPIKTHVGSVLADHVFLLAAADRAAAAKTPNSWFQDKDGLLINAGGKDPRSDGRAYTACVRVDPVYSNGKSHLIFRDLAADEAADVRDGYCFRVMGGSDVRLENCEAYRAGRHHFGVINSAGFVGKGLHCAHAMPNIPGGATFFVSFSDNSRKGDSHEWIDCSAEGLENPGQRNYQVFYDHGEGLGPILIRNMRSKGGMLSADSTAARPITIEGGLIEDASLEVFGSKLHVSGLTISGNGAVDCYGSDCVFENMLMPVKLKDGAWTGYNSAFVFRDGAKRNAVRFCTIAPEGGTALAFVGKAGATTLAGNILLGGRVLKDWNGAPNSGNVAGADFNLYGPAAKFAGNDDKELDLAGWRAAGFDKNSISADPMLAADHSPKPGSPAIGAAKIDASQRPKADIRGTPRTEAACTIGAFEPKK